MNSDLSVFSSPELRKVVQDMRELLSQNRLAFLLGAGCSKCAGLPLMPELTEKVLNHDKISSETRELLDAVLGSFSGAPTATIEDYLSEIVDFLSIAERRARSGAEQPKVLVGTRESDVSTLQNALEEIKDIISSAIGDAQVSVARHQQFVRAIHNSLQAGKTTRTVDYFILNYDTLIEDALGLERILYSDGFTGAATGWWQHDSFRAKENAARVFKVHGSIDWCLLEGDLLPRRVRSRIKTESTRSHVLIYPAATKYQEAQRDPFAQILQDMRQSLIPVKGTEKVLVICGYSFGDSHIDMEIKNALHQSEGRLTIAAFVSTNEPEGSLKDWLEDPTISEQIKVYANRGFYHGIDESKAEVALPWWKFEVLTRLLGGER